MTQVPTPPRPDLTPDLIDAEGPPIARDRFIHGLLETLHRDPPREINARIGSLFFTLGTPVPAARQAPRRMIWRALSGIAAAAAIVGVVMLFIPMQQSAQALVRASINASRTAGDRRYEVRGEFGPEQGPTVRATLDFRDRDHFVARITGFNGDTLYLGRDHRGNWSVRPDGSIDLDPPRQLPAQWVNVTVGAAIFPTVDDLLATLERSYTLSRGTREAAAGAAPAVCDRITAARTAKAGDDPDRVELWIDPASHIVRRVEMLWHHHDGPGAPRPAGPANGDRPLPRGEDLHGPPPGEPPPDDAQRPPPRDGPRGDGPGGDRAARTPSRVVFELVEAPPFAADWFEPQAHAPRP